MHRYAQRNIFFKRRGLTPKTIYWFIFIFIFASTTILLINNRTSICAKISWPHRADIIPHKIRIDKNPASMKIYDVFLFNDELDLLELRFEAHYQLVDYFVITESNVTFTGNPKRLWYLENKSRFAKYNNKVIHYFIPPEELEVLEPRFPRESYARDYPIKHLSCNAEDIVIVSDVDTYLRPHVLRQLKTESAPFLLPISFYYKNHMFSFSWVVENTFHGHKRQTKAGEATDCFNAKLYGGEKTMRIPDSSAHSVFENAGWHCSFCLTVEGIKNKLDSYSHRWNLEGLDDEKIKHAVENGQSLFYTSAEEFVPNDDPLDIPEYLYNNTRKYSYLLGKQVINSIIKIKI